MDVQERQHLVELLQIKRRSLEVLEKQAATFGLQVPPHIVTQIDDIRREITGLEARLDRALANTVGLFSFTPEAIDDSGARVLDWTAYFPPAAPPAATDIWAATLLPSLHGLWRDLAQLPHKAIALHIRAVLSAGLAFGYVFRETTGFRIWIEQQTFGADGRKQTEWWDINAPPVPGYLLLEEETQMRTVDGADSLIEIAISQDTAGAVDSWFTKAGLPLVQRIVIRPPEGPGRMAVKSGAHAVAMARQIEQIISRVRAAHPQGTIHLVGAMPIGLAVLLGTRLNRRGPIQCYEYYQNSYLPSCLLD